MTPTHTQNKPGCIPRVNVEVLLVSFSMTWLMPVYSISFLIFDLIVLLNHNKSCRSHICILRLLCLFANITPFSLWETLGFSNVRFRITSPPQTLDHSIFLCLLTSHIIATSTHDRSGKGNEKQCKLMPK